MNPNIAKVTTVLVRFFMNKSLFLSTSYVLRLRKMLAIVISQATIKIVEMRPCIKKFMNRQFQAIALGILAWSFKRIEEVTKKVAPDNIDHKNANLVKLSYLAWKPDFCCCPTVCQFYFQ